MSSLKPSSLRRLYLLCLTFFILFVPALAQNRQAESSADDENRKRFLEMERRQRLESSVYLEIISPRKTEPIYQSPAGSFGLGRKMLTIVNQEAAGDFSFLEVKTEVEEKTINIRLSLLYNQPSEMKDAEWWKNKKEKEIGQFTIPIGESLRPAELLQFGIEPFEIKVLSNKPVILNRDEYPRIYNTSIAIEVTEVEKSQEGYRLSLKNLSDKDIAVLEISSGNYGFGIAGSLGHSGPGYRRQELLLPSGKTYKNTNVLPRSSVEKYGITIKMMMYSDGTYEGDAKSATRILAEREGYKLQATKLLLLLEKALNVSDEEMPDVFIKMEADLWQMPEAMTKDASIEFLKIKYPIFDEETISMLYEEFKSGFYNARNTVLSDMGPVKRRVEEQRERFSTADKAEYFRRTLIRLKEVIEKATSLNN